MGLLPAVGSLALMNARPRYRKSIWHRADFPHDLIVFFSLAWFLVR